MQASNDQAKTVLSSASSVVLLKAVGKIASIGVDHFSVLVVGVKGVITADRMKKGWKYEKPAGGGDEHEDGSWTFTKQPGHSLRLGSTVRFYIERLAAPKYKL